MHALLFLLFVITVPQDSTVFPSKEELIRLYTDCDESRWPWGLEETFVAKSDSELTAGIVRLRRLEDGWRAWFNARVGDSIAPTPDSAWVYPLTRRERLLNNFANPRAGGPHEALDIFVAREGGPVRTPVAGVVIAAGDDWDGGWVGGRRGDLQYRGGGLSRRAGNGVIVFDPASDRYHYFAHLQRGIEVGTGDVVRAGRVLGRVGHTGNASQPGHGRHLHFAVKRPGNECGRDGVLVPDNPYRLVRAARARLAG